MCCISIRPQATRNRIARHRRDRQVGDERRRSSRSSDQQQRGETPRRAGSCAGFVVDAAAVERAAGRVGREEAAADVRRPCPMNSWLPSMRCPDLIAIARAIDTASVSPSIVIASAIGKVLRSVSSDRSGSDRGGSEAAARRRVVMRRGLRRRAARLSASAQGLPATIAAIMYGNAASRRRLAMPAGSVTRAHGGDVAD